MTRSVAEIVPSRQTREGGGFPVRRPFPTDQLDLADPFLLLDEMGPVEWPPGAAVGAPEHPHYGFETVTYLLAGEMRHQDSSGRSGSLAPGDVQWMTAGRGIVHAEEPSPEFRAAGGLMHGFQLWVNLPQERRRAEPRYQEVPSERIPEADTADGRGTVRVIAGRALGEEAVIDTYIPITYLHVRLRTGGQVELAVSPDEAVYAYVFSGSGRVGAEGRAVGEGEFVIFDGDGDSVRLEASGEAGGGGGAEDGARDGAREGSALEALVLGGRPLREPFARYGPFIAGSEDELREVFAAYREGRFG